MPFYRPTTPLKLTPQILELCRNINNSAPVFVPVQSRPEYPQGNCWENVELHIRRSGGEIQHGWMIWESKGFFVEAEFHSVWKSAEGQLIDITEKEDGETQILFLPDFEKSPEQGYHKNNYKLLRNDAPSKLWLARTQAEQDLREKYYDVASRRWNIPPTEMFALRRKFGW